MEHCTQHTSQRLTIPHTFRYNKAQLKSFWALMKVLQGHRLQYDKDTKTVASAADQGVVCRGDSSAAAAKIGHVHTYTCARFYLRISTTAK
jgi:hypothetical protein